MTKECGTRRKRETSSLSTRSFDWLNANGKRHESPMMTRNKLNKARVADLHTVMSGYVERGDIAGIVTLIAR